MEKKSINLKLVIKNNFSSNFCLGNIPNKFDYSDAKEMVLKGNV